MSNTTTAASGSFSPITGQAPVRTDAEFDLENLSDEEREVVTADQFILFGRASIEQWNEPGPGEDHLYIEMDALEEKLDQLLALNNLSRRHDDVKVGEFLEEHTLDEGTTVHLDDDETLRFDAGDTLRTQVIREGEPLPDGSGPADEDALWIVANVYGRNGPEGSIISQETRLGAYYGHLDGFSVTVYTREYDLLEKGKRATEVDFMAVTVGEDELIKNKGSHFGVAEFQALFGTGGASEADDAGTTPRRPVAEAGRRTAEDLGRTLQQRLTMNVFSHLFSQSKDGLVGETIQVAQQSEQPLPDAAADVVGDDVDADHIAQQAEEKLESIGDRLEQEEMDRDDLAAEVADELGMDIEEVHAIFDELEAAVAAEEGDEPEDPEDPEDPDDDPEDPEQEQQSGIDEEKVRNLIQQEVGDALEDELADLETQSDEGGEDGEYVTQEEFDNRVSELSQQLDDTVTEAVDDVGESVAENLEQQLETGGTPDPSGGSATGESDLKSEVDSVVDGMTYGNGDDNGSSSGGD